MSANHHTPIVFRSPANAETFNEPMAQLDEELTAQASAIGTLQSEMDTAQGEIDTLQSEMDTAQGDISTLQGQVAAAKAPIALCGRLTLVSGNPVPGPVSDADTIYFTPYKGNQSVLWDSPALKTVQFAELALSLDYGPGIEQDSIYDVYLVDDAGTLRIGFGPAWASSVSPFSRGTGAGTTEVALKDGIWVNANDMYLTCGLTHVDVAVNAFRATLLGSFMAVDGGSGSPTGDGKTSDDATLGYLYNVYNQIKRINRVVTTNEHEYLAEVERNWNNTLETKLEVLAGISAQSMLAKLYAQSGGHRYVGISFDDSGDNVQAWNWDTNEEPRQVLFTETPLHVGVNSAIVREIGRDSTGYFLSADLQVSTYR